MRIRGFCSLCSRLSAYSTNDYSTLTTLGTEKNTKMYCDKIWYILSLVNLSYRNVNAFRLTWIVSLYPTLWNLAFAFWKWTAVRTVNRKTHQIFFVISFTKQEALLLQRNRATRYVSWNIMAVFTRTWLRYVRVFAVANPSVCRLSVCNVSAPYSGGWSFRQYFFTAVYAGHPLTSMQNFTEVVPGEPLRRGR